MAASTCSACRGMMDKCSQCGGRTATWLNGTMAVWGAKFAEDTIRRWVSRWPTRWRRSPKAIEAAGRQIDQQLGEKDEGTRAHLINAFLDGAAKRYDEIVGFINGRRAQMPPSPTETDDDRRLP